MPVPAAARSLPAESAPESPSRRWLPAVIGIVCVAAVLRFWRLRSGIPYAIGVDEPEIMERAVRMMKTGDFNPHFFDWPSLTIYLQFIVSCLSFLAGSMRGAWNNLEGVGAADFYGAARGLTAAFGTGTVVLIYLAGRRWGTATALLAAALMAVMPYHVRESHYVLADVPTAFFTTLALLLALRAYERPSLGAFAWAGVSVGLAASCKYNGSVAILLPFIAALAGGGGPIVILQRLLVLAGTAAGGFLLGTPYALLDLTKFLNDYARLAAIFARDRGGEPGWSIYLKHLRGSLGWPALLLGAVGLLVAAGRAVLGQGRVRWAMLIVFPLVYFWVMATSYQIYGRYILPLLPFATLMAAVGIAAIAGPLARLSRVPAAAATTVLVAAAIAIPAWTSVGFDRGLGQTSTVDLAYRWIDAHVPRGSKIAIETRVLLLPPERYPTVNLRWLTERTYEAYVADGFDYLLTSSERYGRALEAPQDLRSEYLAYRALLANAAEVAAFPQSDQVPGPTLRLFRVQR